MTFKVCVCVCSRLTAGRLYLDQNWPSFHSVQAGTGTLVWTSKLKLDLENTV